MIGRNLSAKEGVLLEMKAFVFGALALALPALAQSQEAAPYGIQLGSLSGAGSLPFGAGAGGSLSSGTGIFLILSINAKILSVLVCLVPLASTAWRIVTLAENCGALRPNSTLRLSDNLTYNPAAVLAPSTR